ncbi:hypothetical protein [Chondrinema litorale]|uniref:hypothetical protein n=1 Tax=Chondrinema litorale TaxID=2994555 RepID=UPI0025435A62|nr:hypothetical protein [Chondrinema litorale]UZR99404.1 hypothetical protein OQ292_36075 [Chondrinema litorale]
MKMKYKQQFILLLLFLCVFNSILIAQSQTTPENIKFVRQGVRRFIFDEAQNIPLAELNPKEIIGMSAMFPTKHYLETHADIQVLNHQLSIKSETATQSSIWFAGFNPFATYTIDLAECKGEGEMGFEFANAEKSTQFFISIKFNNNDLVDVKQRIMKDAKEIVNESIATKGTTNLNGKLSGKLILQMLGSGMVLYLQNDALPIPIGQSDFSQSIDLRKKQYINSFQSSLYLGINSGEVIINKVSSALSTGMGLADIRAITYEDGAPFLEDDKIWYTMSIRGRALPHHIEGVFSLDPTTFNLKLEGVILFDRNDGLLRNEIASHIFYDRKAGIWRGLTTGFSAFANPEEEKQLLAVESKKDPRFGFSVMNATPFGIVGDIEDPHILFDSEVNKWRILTCENHEGYKAVMLESDTWNKGYKLIAGPVNYNSTGTSIQKVGGKRYAFSGSSDRKIHIYTYPDLKEAGILDMDLPPWDAESGTRVWPNVVELPEGFPFRYVALMMDRFNYPGLEGPNWSYGALYLYHGY